MTVELQGTLASAFVGCILRCRMSAYRVRHAVVNYVLQRFINYEVVAEFFKNVVNSEIEINISSMRRVSH